MRGAGVPLPGMPLAVGDPGVFVCGPADIAPWETDAQTCPPRSVARPPRGPWLVLTGCMSCNPRTGIYCRDHRADNWWLTNWGTGKKNAPGSTA